MGFDPPQTHLDLGSASHLRTILLNLPRAIRSYYPSPAWGVPPVDEIYGAGQVKIPLRSPQVVTVVPPKHLKLFRVVVWAPEPKDSRVGKFENPGEYP